MYSSTHCSVTFFCGDSRNQRLSRWSHHRTRRDSPVMRMQKALLDCSGPFGNFVLKQSVSRTLVQQHSKQTLTNDLVAVITTFPPHSIRPFHRFSDVCINPSLRIPDGSRRLRDAGNQRGQATVMYRVRSSLKKARSERMN